MIVKKMVGALLVASTVGIMGLPQISHAAETLEILHWWTSGGESKAAKVLKDDMVKQGYEWKDFAVAGGNGAAAMTALKTQVISGNAPTAAQIKGPQIKEWADQGVLVTIDQVADDWKRVLPPAINDIMQVNGHYVAVPFSVHRDNVIWYNKAALDKVGTKAPTTWPEFFAVADKLKAAGIQPIAEGGQPWQDTLLWEDVVLSQGVDFYRKAIIELDQKTLTSAQMVDVFDTVRKLQGYLDNARTGRDWNLATAMVINGKAGMQFMGDWAKGEFSGAGKQPGKDYICSPVPSASPAYTYSVDSFVFFQQKGVQSATPGQLALAKTIMSPDFQEQFSLYKGAVPVRLGVNMDKFDSCGKDSYADEQGAIKSNAYLPSLVSGMAQSDATAGAITDVVTKFVNSNEDSKMAVQDLAKAARTR